MTQTIATQIHELSKTINAIAAAHPHEPTLKVMAWAFDDAANLASGRLRRVLDVPVEGAATATPTVTHVTPVATQDLPESERRILAYVQKQPGTTIDKAAKATAYSRNTTSVVLRTLMRRGQIRRQHGKPAKWWPVVGLP